MKNYKKKITALLTVSALLTTAFMTGCTSLTEAENNAPTEVPGVKNDGEDVTEDDANDEESWKIAFEKSLMDNYGVRPDHYEELDDGVYQVYVEIDGKIVPYVVVDSTTGDYHG